MLSHSGVPLPCTVPPLPAPRYSHTQDGEVACGNGEDDTTAQHINCVSLTASGWTTSHDLLEEREGHSSWLSPHGLLLMGGLDSVWKTELLSGTSSSSSPSFDLEYAT